MKGNFRVFLWLLKLGAPLNLCFLGRTLVPPLASADPHVVIPAQVFFTVSAFRCLFPVRYKDNIVFHDSPLSSIFLTRLLATFSEIALIYQLAYLLRLVNLAQIGWVNALSWLMVFQVVISQVFVWGAILSGRPRLFFYEELGWAFIYAANSAASAVLFLLADDFGGWEVLILINLVFGAVYLPWQFFHLRSLWTPADQQEKLTGEEEKVTLGLLAHGLKRSLRVKYQTSDGQAWGGLIGMTWMASYWAVLLPIWVFLIVQRA